MSMPKATIEQRVFSFIERLDITEHCWNWTGSCDLDGYGMFSINGKTPIRAHRFMWTMYNHKPIPPGGHILHTCDNRKCCNPAHLYLGTNKDNVRDRMARTASKTGTYKTLTKREIAEIYKGYKEGIGHVNMASIFGVSIRTIARAIAIGKGKEKLEKELTMKEKCCKL